MDLLVALLFVCALTIHSPQAVGTIQGIACDVGSCNPIRGVRVSVEIPNSAGLRRTAITADSGVFTLSDLPLGRYQLEAEADGFNPAAVLPLVTLSLGGRADGLRVLMYAQGNISGRAFRENGKPLPYTGVDAMQFRPGDYRRMFFRMLLPVATTTADDRGEFRLAGLSPGEYLIRVSPPVDLADCPVTFYPDTTSPDTASRIMVTGGADVTGIDVKVPRRGFSVAGRFVTDDGRPTMATAVLTPATVGTRVDSLYRTKVQSHEFEIHGVPSGNYYLYAMTSAGAQTPSAPNDLPPQWVRLPIQVGKDDIRDLVVHIAPGGSIAGRVIFAPEAVEADSLDLSRLLLRLGWNEFTPEPIAIGLSTRVSGTGDFHFDHLPEMSFLANPVLKDGWYISRVLFEGSDVTSIGFSVAPGQHGILEVVITNSGGNLTGIITDARNKPAPGARVVLLSQPARPGNPSLSGIALSNEQGEFVIDTIPPGEYTAIAFPPEDDRMPMFLQDPGWVEQYERFGQAIHISPRQTSRADLITVMIDRIRP